MKALVLTYDKNRNIAEHMMHKYKQLWPDHPFIFRIPFQENINIQNENNVEFVKSTSGIRETLLELLNGLDDEEFVYWCMDDKYPVEIDIDFMKKTINLLINENPKLIDGILFCRCRSMWNKKYLNGERINLSNDIFVLERNTYKQIWLHQFLRVKVLKHLFESFPPNIKSAKNMDKYKDDTVKPINHRLYVTEKNYSVFGESTTRGFMTDNCFRSFVNESIELPDWFDGVVVKVDLFGSVWGNFKRRLKYGSVHIVL